MTGQGEWYSLKGDAIKGSWRAALIRDGDKLGGTFDIKGSNVLAGGTVTGSVNGASVMFGLAEDGPSPVVFSGKIDKGAVSGEWEYPPLQDHGVWFGSLSTSSDD